MFFQIFLLILFSAFNLKAQFFINEYSVQNSSLGFYASIPSVSNPKDIIVLADSKEQNNQSLNNLTLLKISNLGKILISKVIDMPGTNEIPNGIIADNNQGYIVLASIDKFDLGDILVVKLDSNFNIIYQKIFKQTLNPLDKPADIVCNSKGEIFIVSSSSNSSNQVHSLRPNFIKLNSSGDLIFWKFLDGYNTFYPSSIILNPTAPNEIIIPSNFRYGTPISNTDNNIQPLLLKFDDLGNLIRAKVFYGKVTENTSQNNGFYTIKYLSDGTLGMIGGSKTYLNQIAPQLLQSGFYFRINNNWNVLSSKSFIYNKNIITTKINEVNDKLVFQGQVDANTSFNQSWFYIADKNGNFTPNTSSNNARLINSSLGISTVGFGNSDNFSSFLDSANKFRGIISGTSLSFNSSSNKGFLYNFDIGSFSSESTCSVPINFEVKNLLFNEAEIQISVTNRNPVVVNSTGIIKDLSVLQFEYCRSEIPIIDTTDVPIIDTVFIPIFDTVILNGVQYFNVDPNPASSEITLSFNLTRDNTKVRLAIYNIIGQKIIDIIDNQILSGNQKIKLEDLRLPNGVYTAVLIRNGGLAAKKLLILEK